MNNFKTREEFVKAVDTKIKNESIKAKQRRLNPINIQAKKWHEKHPERMKVYILVSKAKRKGLLKRKPCRICGEIKSEGHHPDYSKPLKIIWLCRKHHREADKKRRSLINN